MTEYQIRRAASVDELIAASPLFDNPAKAEWAERFLTSQGHHLLLAYVGESPAGFVSGVEMTHPDKGTEMFLYELAVDEAHRNRGIGRALVQALGELAREHGCYGMWVMTERDNPAAIKAYQAGGASRDSDHVMLSFDF
ncbi:MAG TPA: GNAT family N-acetyltransferase [Candidatus Limnocylindrales bacterium]